jgi:hypothetical protein
MVERPGIGDDKPHALLETEPLQVAPLALQIVEAVGLKHVRATDASPTPPRACHQPAAPRVRAAKRAEKFSAPTAEIPSKFENFPDERASTASTCR